jgi:hypothetical protein
VIRWSFSQYSGIFDWTFRAQAFSAQPDYPDSPELGDFPEFKRLFSSGNRSESTGLLLNQDQIETC